MFKPVFLVQETVDLLQPVSNVINAYSLHLPCVSKNGFVLDKKLSITDDEIEGILERTVTKQGTSAKAD